jgi:hypothetical protein
MIGLCGIRRCAQPVRRVFSPNGVISIGDVVRAIIKDHEFSIRQLTSYITAGG